MNKNEIYVPIANKEQAEKYRKILDAIGENISLDYYPYDERTKKLTYSGGWYLSREEWKSRSCITFGELINLLTTPQKIAVKVDNEKDCKILKIHFKSKGWAFGSERWPLVKFYDNSANGFSGNEIDISVDNAIKIGFTVIPFYDFAKEHNIKLPLITSEDGVDLYEGDEFYSVNSESLKFENWGGGKKVFTISVKTPKYFNEKYFSTKQSALDWIEANKPKKYFIDLDGLTAGVYKSEDSIMFNIRTNSLSKQDIEKLYKAIHEINNL